MTYRDYFSKFKTVMKNFADYKNFLEDSFGRLFRMSR